MSDKFKEFKKELDELCKKYGTQIDLQLEGDLIGVSYGICVDLPTDDGRTVRHFLDDATNIYDNPDEWSYCCHCKLFDESRNYCLRYKEFHQIVRTMECDKRIYDNDEGTKSHYSIDNPPPSGVLENE